MRNSDSETLRNLEIRLARLEKQAGRIDDYYLDQYSQSQQSRDERSEARQRKVEGPGPEEFLYGIVAQHNHTHMLSSRGYASIKVPINSFAMRDEDNLISYLNLKIDTHIFKIYRNKIMITYKFERKFTLAFDYKLDRNSESVVLYHGRSFH